MITYDEMGNVISSDASDTNIATPGEFATSVVDYATQQWQDAVSRWQDAVAKFDAQKLAHEALYNTAQALGADELSAWQSQQDKINMIENAITSLRESLATASDWAKSTFGLGSLRSMHALPLIPIAIITGSIAAVAAVTYAIYSYDDQLQKKWDLISAHPEYTPAQVTAILGSSGGGAGSSLTSALGNTSSLVMWIVIGGALYMVLPSLMKEFGKGK